ncbi:hypothetical protein [Hoeflea sp.]
MPDLLIELRSEEIPALALARSGGAARTGRTERSMRAFAVELN